MPELPEIETICQALKAKILNYTIIKATRLTEFNLRQAIPINITSEVVNKQITDISRIAKYINITLNHSLSILIHLGMSGKILLKDNNYVFQKHDHFAFQLNHNQQLVYNDPRRFGLITLYPTEQLASCPLFKDLGVEPLGPDFTIEYFTKILQKKKQPIKLTIMDNHNLVGVGNIYAVESLFLSAISPTREASSLTIKEITILRQKIIEVLEKAIRQGGSSIKDYASVSGKNGHFQNFFNVYGREGKDCKVCGDIIVKITQVGRSSFYCPTCQE